jgi:hypothetical protein
MTVSSGPLAIAVDKMDCSYCEYLNGCFEFHSGQSMVHDFVPSILGILAHFRHFRHFLR